MNNRRLIILTPFVLAIIVWWIYSQVIQLQPIYVTPDPELGYFMSSLSVFKGSPYTFIDHPGTPMEMIGSLIFAATYPFISNLANSFTLSHITHPDIFLVVVRTLLTLASLGTMVLLCIKTVPGRHWTDDLASVAVAVLFFGIHPRAFDSIVNWSHNSFSFPIGSLLGLGAVLLVVEKKGGSTKQIAMLGLSLGVLTAIQLYFVTWVLGAAAALGAYFVINTRDWKRGLVWSLYLSLAAFAGFIVATLPIMNRYQEFISWIVNVASHQGRHGSGAPGFINLKVAANNFSALWKELPLLFVSLGVVVALVAVMGFVRRRSFKSDAGLWAIALGLTLQITVMFTLVIKHPGIIYMQAVAATFPLLLAVALSLMAISIPKLISMQRLIKFGLSLGIFILFTLGFVRALFIHNIVTLQVENAVEEIGTYLDELARGQGRDRQALTALWVYGMPSDCAALWYGNQYANYALAEEVGLVCPRDLTFDLWGNRVVLSDGSSVLLGQSNWDVMIVHEAALIDFPDLAENGEMIYAHSRLGTFGQVVYILPIMGKDEIVD